ncbi:MAG: GvpL/GvpF family gas vesicle protein, partial [Acidobacteria bacterium]|nr:GvpL/GvpF family gas vesicle protein [Acidobacteriota bacterium]
RLGRGRSLGERIVRTLSRMASDLRRRESIEQVPGSRVLLDVAYLVPRRATTRFEHRVRSLAVQARKAGYDIILSGPWPPYHFVGQDSEGARVTASPGLSSRARKARRGPAGAPSRTRTLARRRAPVRR